MANIIRIIGAVLCLLLATLYTASAASIFDLIGSSVSNLATTQEEVPYTLVSRNRRYEERLYPSQAWVCKKHTGALTSAAQQTAFLSLFDYLAGDNKIEVVMRMAKPASVRAPADPAAREYEACFYPGAARQVDTPQPTNAELYVLQRPQMTVFTRKFGGYATDEQEWRQETQKLLDILRQDDQPIADQHYFWNAFDSPIKFWNRRNEVWIVKAE